MSPSAPRRTARRASIAVYAAGPVAVVAIVFMARADLLAPTPTWVLAAIILSTGATNYLAGLWLAESPGSTFRLHVRVALAAVCTAAVVYAAGWGSLLVVGYVVVSAEMLRTAGARSLRPTIGWTWVVIVCGEVAVAVGVAPSMIRPALGHAVALVGAICFTIGTDVLARTAAAAERAERLIRHDAHHDPLTGLLNRAAFAERSERACAAAAAEGRGSALLFVDLDGFKEVNDTFGHDVGDDVLVRIARRLADGLDDRGVIARLGGDEFGVLLAPVDSADDAVDVAQRLLARVAEPIEGLPGPATVGASIGIALRDREGIEMSTLMRRADAAMYAAKRDGRTGWALSGSVPPG